MRQDLVEGRGGVVGKNGGLHQPMGKGERQSTLKSQRHRGDGEVGEQSDHEDGVVELVILADVGASA